MGHGISACELEMRVKSVGGASGHAQLRSSDLVLLLCQHPVFSPRGPVQHRAKGCPWLHHPVSYWLLQRWEQ